MNITDIVTTYISAQIVLSLSNNNNVLITPECINPYSKFYRMSRIRMGCEFELSGSIKHDVFNKDADCDIDSCDALIYRTYRGKDKTDYILYVYLGEYKLLESYKKVVSYKRVIKEGKQLTINSITEPDVDSTFDIRPVVLSYDKCQCVYRSSRFIGCDIHQSKIHSFNMDFQYGYYYAVLVGLNAALKYSDMINHVRVLCPSDDKLAGIYQFPLKKWIPNNKYTISYMDRVISLRDKLQRHGITISFVVDKNRP